MPRSGPCDHPALPPIPRLQLIIEREHLGLWVGSSAAPPARNKTQKRRAKTPDSLEMGEQSWTRTPRLAQCGPASSRSPAAPPAPHRSRREPRGRRGTRRSAKAPGPPRGLRGRGSGGKAPATKRGGDRAGPTPGGLEGDGGRRPAQPAAYREPGAPRGRGGACGPRSARERRSRAGVSPRPPPPSPAGRAGRERRRRFTTGPGGREAPHAAACSAGGYIYPARSLPQRARPSQSESGARPHSDAGWPMTVVRRGES